MAAQCGRSIDIARACMLCDHARKSYNGARQVFCIAIEVRSLRRSCSHACHTTIGRLVTTSSPSQCGDDSSLDPSIRCSTVFGTRSPTCIRNNCRTQRRHSLSSASTLLLQHFLRASRHGCRPQLLCNTEYALVRTTIRPSSHATAC